MKRRASSVLSILLALILLVGIFPVTVFAADDEFVLTTINHLSAVSIVDVTGTHSATFTVPYTFSGTLDFSSGLDITYDTTVYASASASFPSGSAAAVDGDPVAMTVTYQRNDDTALYTAQYSLNVVRAAAVPPVFTGIVSKAFTVPEVLTFTAEDFAGLYTQNDGGALSAIAVTGSDPTFGSLKLGNEDYVFGTAVSLAELQAGSLTFAATAVGTVSYTVNAYAEGAAETLLGAVALTITVSAAESAGTVTYTTEQNTPVTFAKADFTSTFCNATGNTLSYVMFTLPASGGTLYYGYTSAEYYDSAVSADTKYYAGDQTDLSEITFVPGTNYTGTVEIIYTAYTAADVGVAGKVIITVAEKENEEETSDHFNDVGNRHRWAVQAVDYLCEAGIITGDGKGHYNPVASISRGDFVLMLCRAFDLSADSKGNFSDVEEDSYYSGAIAAAKALKIAKGSGGKFNPKSSLSRQDAMVLMVRAMEAAGYTLQAGDENGLKAYSDSSKISDYAAEAVAALVDAGIIQGSGGKLNPKSSVSRAEMAVILYRVLTMQ